MGNIQLKPHNLKPRNEILAAFKDGIRTLIYVAGVGLGKSYVFMGVLDMLGKDTKVLYVLPKHVIKENLYEYEDFKKFNNQIDFVTFNYFTDANKGLNLISTYDLVVVDECHHLGSELYGKTLLYCMQESNSKFLGLTATPYRDADKIDVGDYFEKRIDGLSNFDAIRLGLMPEIIYEMCIPEQNINDLEKSDDCKVKLDYTDSSETVMQITKKYPRNKWICFFPDVNTLKKMKPEIKKIFTGYKILTLYSELGNLKEVVNDLKENEKAVVLSVNILLEGVHFESVDGICLYRNVTSITCFQQIIGRICSVSKTVNPVIIDCSRSGESLYVKLLYENEKKAVVQNWETEVESKKEIIKIGINGHEQYDIQKMLEKMKFKEMSKEMINEAANEALKKYLSFNGKLYKNMDDLKKDKLNYKKLEACARMYKIPVGRVFYTMNSKEE